MPSEVLEMMVGEEMPRPRTPVFRFERPETSEAMEEVRELCLLNWAAGEASADGGPWGGDIFEGRDMRKSFVGEWSVAAGSAVEEVEVCMLGQRACFRDDVGDW